MALEIFLKLDGIQGESTIKGHEKETLVLSYEQGIDHPQAPSVGAGGSAGKSTLLDVRFRKPVDIGSVPLLLACASGKHLEDARFTFRQSGAGVDFYKVTLEDVLVTRIVQLAGTGVQYPLSFGELRAGDENQGFLDEATLHYVKITWEYLPMRADGSTGPPVKGGWDLKANKKL